MQVILSDHNCEGQARAIFDILEFDKTWPELVPMELKWFKQVDLSIKEKDSKVWQFCQDNEYLLLTGNRSGSDKEESLEQVIRNLVTLTSLPVITIGNLKRVTADPIYRKRCAERLAEIVYDLEDFRGVMRIFIP
ncbi:MAG: ACP S-malonyltransferase [Chloroflexota bacterium]